MVNPGLDIVELMILLGIGAYDTVFDHVFNKQAVYAPLPKIHAIEVRLYCENPAAQFQPSPGVLQRVEFPKADWLRVESWVETGTTITPYYDPLACKLIVTGDSRAQAVARLLQALSSTNVYGPPNNVQYLRAICASDVFRAGNATTTFLDTFSYTPWSALFRDVLCH